MIIYYIWGDNTEINKSADGSYESFAELKAAIPTAVEKTEAEYDTYVLETKTLPALTADNINHNYFNAAETAIRKEKQRYQNSLFSITLATIQNVTPAVPFVAHVRYLKSDDLVLYENFQEFLKEAAEIDLLRATTYYDSKIAGDTDEVARTKAQAFKVDLKNIKAMNGKSEFIAWLSNEHPDLRKYQQYVDNLNYTTVLTEDEPE